MGFPLFMRVSGLLALFMHLIGMPFKAHIKPIRAIE